MGLRIHYLVQADDGIIQSGGIDVNTPHGKVKTGQPGRWRAACDPTVVMNETNLGTGETWAVHCRACFETEVFKKNYQPRPGSTNAKGSESSVAPEDMSPCGCD